MPSFVTDSIRITRYFSTHLLLCWLQKVLCKLRKLLAECSLEMYSQSEDKQADCLSKNASIKIYRCIFASFGLPELNYTALANEASVSEIAQYLCREVVVTLLRIIFII